MGAGWYNKKMRMDRLTRHFAAWLACFAVLFAALAPSISHAMSAAKGEPWAEICTIDGAKFVKIGGDQLLKSDPGTQKSMHFEHCPFCATHGGSLALPRAAALAVPLLETHETYPFLFFQSPRPLAIWVAAQSRAPPAQA